MQACRADDTGAGVLAAGDGGPAGGGVMCGGGGFGGGWLWGLPALTLLTQAYSATMI